MPITFGGGIFGGGGGVSGSGASGRLALWSGAGTLTSDAGLTYSGTGATARLAVTSLQVDAASSTYLRADPILGDLGVYAAGTNIPQFIIRPSVDGHRFRSGYALGWASGDPTATISDVSLSRISAGVLAVGTGAAGSYAGTLKAANIICSPESSTTPALHYGNVYVGFGFDSILGSPYIRNGTTIDLVFFSDGLRTSSDRAVMWTSGVANISAPDTFLSRRAAATLQLGAADSATPVAQTIAFQGATGENIAGQDATIQGSLGTGTAASGKLVFKVGTPTTTGSTQHTANTVLTLQDTGAGGTPSPAVIAAGPVTSTQFRLSALNTAPSSAADTGTLGEIRIDSGYIYVCTATNTWVRAALATWP